MKDKCRLLIDKKRRVRNRIPKYHSIFLLPRGQNSGEQSNKTQPGGPAILGKTLSEPKRCGGAAPREKGEGGSLHKVFCLHPSGKGLALQGQGLFPSKNREKPWDSWKWPASSEGASG